MFLPMSCRSPCTLPISTLPSFFGPSPSPEPHERFGDAPDGVEHFAGDHQLGQEVFAPRTVCRRCPSPRAEIEHARLIDAFLQQHPLGEGERFVFLHVRQPIDELAFLFAHLAHDLSPSHALPIPIPYYTNIYFYPLTTPSSTPRAAGLARAAIVAARILHYTNYVRCFASLRNAIRSRVGESSVSP